MKINQNDITMATYYDNTMGNDVARDAHCEIKMGNDIVTDIHCDVTMSNGIAMRTYHGITMYNDVDMNLFVPCIILLWILWNKNKNKFYFDQSVLENRVIVFFL